MKYDEVISKIESGDLFLFRRSKTLFGAIIRIVTQSPFSHVGVAVWIRNNHGCSRLTIVEALEGVGVRLYPLDRYLDECRQGACLVDWYKVCDDGVDKEKVAEFALSQWGAAYARPFQFVWSWGKISSRLRRWMGWCADLDERRWFCSELAARALLEAGYVPDAAEPIVAALTDPGTIALLPCVKRMGVLE